MPLTTEELETFKAAVDFSFMDVETTTAFLNKLPDADQREFYNQVLDKAEAFHLRLQSPEYIKTLLARIIR